MKIFLGVLHDDALFQNVGLDRIDPRRLADGGNDEVLWTAALLCWMGGKNGYSIQNGASSSFVHQLSSPPLYPLDRILPFYGQDSRRRSPSVKSTTASNTMSTNFSMNQSAVVDSNTSIETTSEFVMDQSDVFNDRQYHDSRLVLASIDDNVVEEDSHIDYSHLPLRAAQSAPRCIHEIRSPGRMSAAHLLQDDDSRYSELELTEPEQSSSFYRDFANGAEQSTQTSVRYDGWIEEVDAEDEIRSFEARKNRSRMSAIWKRHSQPQVSFLLILGYIRRDALLK